MKKIAVLADSGCQLPIGSLEDQGIYIVPLTITMGNKTYLDLEEISANEVFERMNIECKELLGISEAKQQPVSGYFTTMEKIIDIIWNEAEAIVPPGRGSAGGYIIDYLVGITQVNPLKQGVEMPHFRFISAERPDYPKQYWGWMVNPIKGCMVI